MGRTICELETTTSANEISEALGVPKLTELYKMKLFMLMFESKDSFRIHNSMSTIRKKGVTQ